jgi:hypothetical protein
MKCLKTEKDKRFNTLLQSSFCVLKIKSKFQKLGLLKYARNPELAGTFTSREHKQGKPT